MNPLPPVTSSSTILVTVTSPIRHFMMPPRAGTPGWETSGCKDDMHPCNIILRQPSQCDGFVPVSYAVEKITFYVDQIASLWYDLAELGWTAGPGARRRARIVTRTSSVTTSPL